MYGGNFNQTSTLGESAEVKILEGVDSFDRTITPIQYGADPYSYIHDLFTPTGDGGFTNGAGSSGGREIPLLNF